MTLARWSSELQVLGQGFLVFCINEGWWCYFEVLITFSQGSCFIFSKPQSHLWGFLLMISQMRGYFWTHYWIWFQLIRGKAVFLVIFTFILMRISLFLFKIFAIRQDQLFLFVIWPGHLVRNLFISEADGFIFLRFPHLLDLDCFIFLQLELPDWLDCFLTLKLRIKGGWYDSYIFPTFVDFIFFIASSLVL